MEKQRSSEQALGAHEYERQAPWGIDFTKMSDGELDPRIWHFSEGRQEADYNGEAQTYTNDKKNVRIEGGQLVIETHAEHRDGQLFTSARVNTLGSFDFEYGTIEVETALPDGAGTWPAAWLLPSNPRYDPAQFGISWDDPSAFAVNGEIDFLEAVGIHRNQNIPATHSYNSRHTGQVTYTPGKVADAYNEFHTYGVIKKPGLLEFTIDGEVYASRKKESDDPLQWPFEQRYYLILNLAMGGPWAGSETEKFPPNGIDMSMQEHWKYRIKKINYVP